MKCCKWLGALLLIAVSASAQAATGSKADKGLYGDVSYSTAHDSAIGWTAESDYSAGYDFNSHVAFETGIPVWLIATTQSTSTSGTTTQTTKSGVLGDIFARFNFNPQFKTFGYKMSVTGTAPTGDTKLGVSTGRAGLYWNNHVQKDFGPVTPFGEFGLSNMQGSDQHFHKAYSVLGKSAGFRGGADLDLTHHFSVEASVYDVAPFGTQKVYSRVIPRNATNTMIGTAKKGRQFMSQAVTTGDSSIAADHGFSAGMSFDPRRRISFGFDYNHSIVQSLDSVDFTIAYHFGHIAGAKPPRS